MNQENTKTLESPLSDFRNEPQTDFSLEVERSNFSNALKSVATHFPQDVSIIIDGREEMTSERIESLDPSDFRQIVASSAAATSDHVDKAVKAARKAYPEWRRTSPGERANIILRAAELMRERKHELSAIAVREAGKPWREADADVEEAIDFLEFYAREALRLGAPRRLQPWLLGEHNDLVYTPLGVVGVIGPWNFPVAIPTGMTTAALAAGNTVILKPAEQTPLVAWLVARIFHEAGLPDGVLNFLPGRGEVCGERLVRHPDVNMIVFTGSREVGLRIIRSAAETPEGQHFVKRVVTEMGGKNAIIVDSSADLDSAVPDILYSAFGFSGQKCSACSRLIVLEDLYKECLDRLREGAAALKIGRASEPSTQVGPVIDGEARDKILGYIELGRKEARTIHGGDVGGLASEGFFVAPHIFESNRGDHPLMREEIFGPVLTVIKAGNFSEALDIANDTPYALTGGVQSRTPSNLRRARQEFEVGNLYLNRTITGAIVGRQPFGGYRLSGIGSKAGGPDYLKQFMVSRVVSENMMRHGMASLVEGPPDNRED
ncbi:MAG: L-glutamate gamma-semialdehyde dehydrogenase [Candidatus Sumerlaeia bacterium]|nr:L-glutamate gamma-semialdehyde dehydrogenase [Candidatus Sumerlaeia bacterium]